MWQVVQRGNVQDYGMVEEFVSTVSEIVPELLNADQKAQLLLGLRARVGVRSGFIVKQGALYLSGWIKGVIITTTALKRHVKRNCCLSEVRGASVSLC